MAHFCEADHCAPKAETTPREAIAYVLGGSLFGFGSSVRASVRIKIADAIIAALGAAGFAIVRKSPSN